MKEGGAADDLALALEPITVVGDGVFLLCPELDDLWDERIFVEADFAVTLERAIQRDTALFGDAETTRLRYERRYIPGQRLYLERVRPHERAEIVIDNNDPRHPVVYDCGGSESPAPWPVA